MVSQRAVQSLGEELEWADQPVHAVDHSARPTIAEIRVQELFGQYSYVLPVAAPIHFDPDQNRLLLLYGDNGRGKTTILNLVYHLLSAEPNRGHKTYLARTPFKNFAVSLGSGTTITANRVDGQLIGDYVLSVVEQNQVVESFYMEVDESGKIPSNTKVEREQAERLDELSEYLDGLKIGPYYLTESRTFLHDGTETESDRSRAMYQRFRRTVPIEFETYIQTLDDFPLMISSGSEAPRAARQETELASAVSRFESWLRRQNYRGTSSGSASANGIYRDVLAHIARSTDALDVDASDLESITLQLDDLSKRSSQYAEFGLGTPFSSAEFLESFATARHSQGQLMTRILKPHLEGVQARLDALEGVYEILVRTTAAIGSLLQDKEVRIHVDEGISIVTDQKRPIPLSALSSGEKQLLLIIFNVLAAREDCRLFIIDEPEISLNVKWQRALLELLLSLTAGTQMQFLLATHSIELLSGHRSRVAQLSNENG